MLNQIYGAAKLCRAFEVATYSQIKKGNIKTPVYLSAGQETISCSISAVCGDMGIQPFLFGQHRCHSIYLAFGGDPVSLIDELLGKGDWLRWWYGRISLYTLSRDRNVWT